jgi:hypothetical protein
MKTFEMRRHFSFAVVLLGLTLQPVFAPGQQLTVQAASGKQTVLSRADLEALPRVKFTMAYHDAAKPPTTFEGVLLGAVLAKAGVELGESLKGKGMASCLLVEAADGYRVVIALPEIDFVFTQKQFILVLLKDGKPLDDKEGPYRIVIPEEHRMARWVRQVTTLKIVDVQ